MPLNNEDFDRLVDHEMLAADSERNTEKLVPNPILGSKKETENRNRKAHALRNILAMHSPSKDSSIWESDLKPSEREIKNDVSGRYLKRLLAKAYPELFSMADDETGIFTVLSTHANADIIRRALGLPTNTTLNPARFNTTDLKSLFEQQSHPEKKEPLWAVLKSIIPATAATLHQQIQADIDVAYAFSYKLIGEKQKYKPALYMALASSIKALSFGDESAIALIQEAYKAGSHLGKWIDDKKDPSLRPLLTSYLSTRERLQTISPEGPSGGVGAVSSPSLEHMPSPVTHETPASPTLETPETLMQMASAITPPAKPTTPVTERLYAQICNDAYLAGAFDLEGHDSRITIAFLNTYMLKHKDKLPAAAQLVSSALSELEAFNRKTDPSSQDLQAIVTKISSLKTDEFILLPGGHLGDPGHAMVYELQKNKDGDLIIKIYNSGSGLELHRKHGGKYDPVMIYEIKHGDLDKKYFKKNFTYIIKKLMDANLGKLPVGQMVTNTQQLYNDIIAKLALAGAKLRVMDTPPTPQELSNFTLGQLSGTCSQSVLHELLKSHFTDKNDYVRFIYGFKVYALDNYIATLKSEGTFLSPKTKGLILKGIKSNLRLLNRLSHDESYVFEETYRRSELERLNGYLLELDKITISKTPDEPTPIDDLKPTPAQSNTFLLKSHAEPTQTKTYIGRERKAPPTTQLPKRLSPGETVIADLTAIISEIDSLIESGQYDEAKKRLEFLVFTELTLPKDIIGPLEAPYAAINTDEAAQSFFKLMRKVDVTAKNLYEKEGQSLGMLTGYTTAIEHHISLHCMALSAHVFSGLPAFKRQPEEHKKFLTEILSSFSPIKNRLTGYFLASMNPIVDKNYVQLCALVSKIDITDQPDSLNTKADYEFEMFKNSVQSNTDLTAIGIALFKLQKEKELLLYEEALERHRKECLRIEIRRRPEPPTSPALFLENLEKNNLHAMYGLIHHIDEFKKNKYSELDIGVNGRALLSQTTTIEALKRFHQEFESVDTFKLFFSNQSKSLTEPRKNWHYDLQNNYGELSICNYTKRSFIIEGQKLTGARKRYAQLAPSYATALALSLQDNYDSQVITQEEDPLLRELQLLRLAPAVQVPLTIDYFSKHLLLLTNVNNQTYMEAHLFEPGLLHQEISTNSDRFLHQFDTFVADGLRIFNDGDIPTKNSLFFVRLNCLIYQYAARIDGEKYKEQLRSHYTEITKLINASPDKNLKSSLLKYRMLYAKELKKLYPEEASEFLDDDLEALFALNIYPSQNENLDQENLYQASVAQKYIIDAMEEKKISDEDIIRSLKVVFTRLGKELTNYSVKTNFPYFIFTSGNETFHVNVVTAMIYKDGLALVAMKDELKNHPIIKRFGLDNETYCYYSSDNPPVKTVKKGELEIRLQYPHTYIRGLEGFPSDKWFKVFANNAIDARELKLWDYIEDGLELSATIADHGTLRLIECGTALPQSFGLVKDDKLIIKGTLDASGKATLAEVDSGRILCVQETSRLTLPFTAFENEKYIDVYHDPRTSSYQIELKRYGLTFNKESGSDELTCIYNGETFRLKTSTTTTIEKGIPQLLLINDASEEMAIFPIGQFTVGEGRHRNSAYKHFIIDIKDDIADKIADKKMPYLSLNWERTRSKESYMIKIIAGEPAPENSEEALYLAYLYLGAHQPEKAWSMLELCDKKFGGITGKFTELKYIQWITKALPFDIDSIGKGTSYTSKTSIEDTPEVVSCQLKALSLVARLDANALSLDSEIANPKTQNDLVENHHRSSLKTFFEGSELQKQIHNRYTRLLQFREADEALIQYALTTKEQWILLSYGNDSLPPAIAIEHHKLYIGILNQALDNLRRMPTQDAKVQQKIEHLESIIFNISTVSLDTTGVGKVILRDKDIQFPKDATAQLFSDTNLERLTFDTFFDKSISKSEELIAAMDALHDEISDNDVLTFFTTYVKIAESKAHPDYESIRAFSKRTIEAYSQSPLLREKSISYLLATILYRIAENPTNMDFCLKAKGLYSRKRDGWDVLHAYLKDRRYSNNDAHYDSEKLKASKQLFKETILELAESYTLKPLEIMTTKKIATKIISPNDIQSTLTAPKPDRVKVSTGTSTSVSDLFQQWFSDKHQTLKQCLLESQTQDAATTTDTTAQHGTFFSSEEFTEGNKSFEKLKRLKAAATTSFSDNKDNTSLKTNLEVYKETLTNELSALEISILGLATSKLTLTQQIAMKADVSPEITLNRLLGLYFQNDRHTYGQVTSLSDAEIDHLHTLLIEYVSKKTAYQQTTRSLELVTKLIATTDTNERDGLKLQLAQELLAQNRLDAAIDTELSAFQMYNSMLLREKQVSTLNKLLTRTEDQGFYESVEKVGMGEGKSKIILPTLAQKKADGSNLVIIEVPRALLQTNYADLRATSLELFNQEAFIFNFDRTSDCSPDALKKLYNNILFSIQNKDYMVTTGESLQSLELKYFELLHNPQGLEGYETSLPILDQLIKLLKERGELIIDEAHEGLDLKNKLNYTLGRPSNLTIDIAQASVSLYAFIYEQEFTLSGVDSNIRFIDILEGKIKLSPNQHKEVTEKIATSLMDSETSPIKHIIEKYLKTSDEISDLKDYLLNQASSMPPFINLLTPGEKEIISFYKAEISQFLSTTINRDHLVNYGESFISSMRPEERAIAIPYRSNKAPKYGSSFGDEIEAVNYTIQSMLLSGITEDLFIKLLLTWQEKSKSDAILFHKEIDDTDAGALFKKISSQSLASIDVRLPRVQQELYGALKNHKDIIFSALKELVLTHIKIDKRILHSDAYNHVDIVHSCQGITGTPWNSSTFHQRLQYNKATSLGTDGYVISAILEKKPKFIGLDFENTKDFVKALLTNTSGRTRAIIDISATFKGVENEDVALELSSYIAHHQATFTSKKPKIKYILYFNEDNQLSALPVTNDNEKKLPIIIGSSDPKIISRKLSCTPEELFTFYDQAHTVGTDIKQEDDAKAIVLVNQQTELHHFLQGSLRMRGLINKDQSLDIIMPVTMATELTKVEGFDYSAFVEKLNANETSKLLNDNYYAALAKIKNVIRNDFCRRILEIDSNDISKKQALFKHFEDSFIETKVDDLFAKFGVLGQWRDTRAILEDVRQHTLSKWVSTLLKAGFRIDDEEKRLIDVKLETILATTGAICEQQLSTHTQASGSKETMKEQQIEQQVEIAEAKKTTTTFEHGILTNRYTKLELQNGKPRLTLQTLNEECRTSIFDETLQLSSNFSKNSAFQKTIFEGELKPIHALYFRRDAGKLYCQLITQQECDEIYSTVAADTSHNTWISTTSHRVLAGEPDGNFMNDESYQRLITQARYFNGEFYTIINDETVNSKWLKERALEKIDFFEQRIFSLRPTPLTEMKLARDFYSGYTAIANDIIANPHIKTKEIKLKFPHFKDADIREILDAALKLNTLITSWNKAPFADKCISIKDTFGIFSSEFEKHLRHLALLKSVNGTINARQTTAVTRDQLHQDRTQLSDIDINLLRTLQRTLQRENKIDLTSTNNYALLYAFALNKALSIPELTTVIAQSSANLTLRSAVLSNNNPRVKVSTDDLEHFITAEKQSTLTLGLMASHPNLSDSQAITLYEKIKKHPDQNNLICRIFLNKKISSTALLSIVEKAPKLSDTTIKALLTRDDNLDPNLFKLIVQKHPHLSRRLVGELIGKQTILASDVTKLGVLLKQITKERDLLPQLIHVFKHPLCTDNIVKNVLEQYSTIIPAEHLITALQNKNIAFSPNTRGLIAKKLIEAISKCSSDHLTNEAIRKVVRNYTTPDTLDEFIKIYNAVNSPVMQFVRAKISQLRSPLYVIGGKAKATAIEDACASIPVTQRLNYPLDTKNALSFALAKHRFVQLQKTESLHYDYRWVKSIIPGAAANSYKAYDAFFRKTQAINTIKLAPDTITQHPVIDEMKAYKITLEKRKGSYWVDKINALDFAIKALEEKKPIDLVMFETYFPHYARGVFSHHVKDLINEAIAISNEIQQPSKPST